MLSFGDMPSGPYDSHSWLWLGLWLIIYRVNSSILIALLGEQRFRSFVKHYCWMGDVKEHLASQICPKRRARYLKCTKRCQARRRNKMPQPEDDSSSSSTTGICDSTCQDSCDKLCEIGKLFIKLHLPPPLPFFKRKKTRQCSDGSSTSCPDHCVCCRCRDDASCTTEAGSTSDESEIPAKRASVKLARSSSASLIDMARMQQWTALMEHVNRRGAKYRDHDGLYPLHWACSGSPPVEVVQALLTAYPSAAHKVDAEGSTPLHFATHYSAPLAVIETVLKAYPKAISMQDKYGRTPLYHAVEKSLSLEVIKLLAQAESSCILLPCLPVDKRTLPLKRDTAIRSPLYLAWASALKDRQTRLKCKGKQWDKAEYLLTAVTKQGTLMERLISMDLYLPEQLATLMLHARPDLVVGANALAAAASTLHYSRERSTYLIRLLLQHNTGAASMLTSDGRSILGCVAASNQPVNAIDDVFAAAPQTLLWRDRLTGLPPALLAATSNRPALSSQGSLSTRAFNPDPYNLLTAKQKELLNMSTPTASAEPETPINADALHINTIFTLLQKDPSVILNQSAAECRPCRFKRASAMAVEATAA